MHKSLFKIITTIFSLAILVLWIVSITGLVYLTQFSYQSKDVDNLRTIKLNDTEMTMAKITVTLQWINLGLSFILFLIGIGYSLSNK
jgi:hypothetical protein